MQFKVICALAFATLAAAGALPRDDTNPNPPTTNSANTDPANTNHGTTNSGNTNPGNTNSGNTNPGNTNPGHTSPGNTNQGSNIAPPYPGTPLPTIDSSKCSAGHLRCCKFHFPKIVIVLQWKPTTIIGKSAQSPNAPAVAPLLPSGISAASISGLVGVTCTALPVGAQPNDWFVSTRSMNDFKLNFLFFFFC